MLKPEVKRIVPGVIAIDRRSSPTVPPAAYVVLAVPNYDNILIKHLNGDYTKETDVDCLYEHYILYNSETEYLLYYYE